MFIHPCVLHSRDCCVSPGLHEPRRTEGQEGERGRIATLTNCSECLLETCPQAADGGVKQDQGRFSDMETPWEAELTQLLGETSEEHSVRVCRVKR